MSYPLDPHQAHSSTYASKQPPSAIRHAALAIRRKVAMMVNRFEIRPMDGDGAEGSLIAVAERGTQNLGNDLTFWADERRRQPIFLIEARDDVDSAAAYDVLDHARQPLGWFRQEYAMRFGRSVWTAEDAQGHQLSGVERNGFVAALRRIKDSSRFNNWYHVDFTTSDGEPALHHERLGNFDDWSAIDLPLFGSRERLDWRFGAALGVALELA